MRHRCAPPLCLNHTHSFCPYTNTHHTPHTTCPAATPLTTATPWPCPPPALYLWLRRGVYWVPAARRKNKRPRQQARTHLKPRPARPRPSARTPCTAPRPGRVRRWCRGGWMCVCGCDCPLATPCMACIELAPWAACLPRPRSRNKAPTRTSHSFSSPSLPPSNNRRILACALVFG